MHGLDGLGVGLGEREKLPHGHSSDCDHEGGWGGVRACVHVHELHFKQTRAERARNQLEEEEEERGRYCGVLQSEKTEEEVVGFSQSSLLFFIPSLIFVCFYRGKTDATK